MVTVRNCESSMNILAARYDGGVDCWADVTGAPLIENCFVLARTLQMRFFTEIGVYSERLPKSVVNALEEK